MVNERFRARARVVLICLGLFWVSLAARAEFVFFKDGSILEVTNFEQDGQNYRGRVASSNASGKKVENKIIPKEDVLRVMFLFKVRETKISYRVGETTREITGFIVDESVDNYTFRPELRQPKELTIPKDDIITISFTRNLEYADLGKEKPGKPREPERGSHSAGYLELGGAILGASANYTRRITRGNFGLSWLAGAGLLSAHGALSLGIGSDAHALETVAGLRLSFLYERPRDLALPYLGLGYRYWSQSKGMFIRLTFYGVYGEFSTVKLLGDNTSEYRFQPWAGLSVGSAF